LTPACIYAASATAGAAGVITACVAAVPVPTAAAAAAAAAFLFPYFSSLIPLGFGWGQKGGKRRQLKVLLFKLPYAPAPNAAHATKCFWGAVSSLTAGL